MSTDDLVSLHIMESSDAKKAPPQRRPRAGMPAKRNRMDDSGRPSIAIKESDGASWELITANLTSHKHAEAVATKHKADVYVFQELQRGDNLEDSSQRKFVPRSGKPFHPDGLKWAFCGSRSVGEMGVRR